jgi:hypothetical protein
MTAQLVDQIQFNGQVYQICEYAGQRMFTAEQLGITPVMRATCSWRGLWAAFAIVESRVQLDVLLLESDVAPPAINGVTPERIDESRDELFEYRYRDLKLPLQFDSRMIVGAKPIGRMRLPQDFRFLQEYLYWEEVRYWEFVGGQLSRQLDCSELVDSFRNEYFERRDAKDVAWEYKDVKELGRRFESRIRQYCGTAASALEAGPSKPR